MKVRIEFEDDSAALVILPLDSYEASRLETVFQDAKVSNLMPNSDRSWTITFVKNEKAILEKKK